MKKILTIIIIAVILGAIGFSVWLFSGEETPADKIEIIGSFFPFGNGRDLPVIIPPEPVVQDGAVKERILVQISQGAVSGAAMGTSTIRYVEKSTGHIYETDPQGKEQNRLSNITILKTFEAVWPPNADKVMLRYAEDGEEFSIAQNYAINLEGENGIFFPQSIKSAAASPDDDKMFYLAKFGKETIGVVSSFENEDQDQIFSSPFGEFNIDWPNKNIISLLSKPSVFADGFLYSLNPKTESLEKVLGGIKGLTVLWSPSVEKIIYSKSGKNTFSALLYDIESKESSSFSLRTLPEKCVWSRLSKDEVYCGVPKILPRADYPDDWYQGLVSFSDSIWKIDIASGLTEEIYETGSDAINLFFSADENYLFFTNKKDNTLWSLKLKE